MAAKPNPDPAPGFPWAWLAGLAMAGAGLLWFFPLWRIVPLVSPARVDAAAFDAAQFAARFWTETLPAAHARAVDAAVLAAALRRDPAEAVRLHARTVGLGTAYYHVRGTGRVTAVERNAVVLALEGADGATLALETGPIFGNTVRDGTALLDVNTFPSLADFNAVSAALNRMVEDRVQPELRRRAVVGARIEFAGCAEVDTPVAGRPLLTLIPLSAEVRPAP
jgi:predicted lipoprotein